MHMKKGLIAALVTLVALGVVAIITCPDRLAHKDAIMSVVNEKIDDGLTESNGGEADGLTAFLGSLGSSMAGYFLENRLTVKNCFVCSIGYLRDMEGVDNKVSVGVFGHVFTFNKEDLDAYLEGMI